MHKIIYVVCVVFVFFSSSFRSELKSVCERTDSECVPRQFFFPLSFAKETVQKKWKNDRN